MDKTLIAIGALMLGLAAVTAAMVVTSSPVKEAPMIPAPTGDPATPDSIGNDPLALAKQFVMNDPTFRFDGMAETLNASLIESGDPVVAVVEFTSRQAGYGDRTGMMLAQVLTPHRCILKISGGRVQYAVMDGKWDMIAQKEIEN